ncbi:FmdB family zinc ribbon protein [Luteitalea sp.]|jgi:putative FmdB family regulatory protein|uniref:FmdB family zinc ribbon protein n=1 Tax=Luteitalea sp. TaxID=2004800 RepID=UPI0037CB5662
MPLYEYQCDTCGHRFEVIQKFSDAPLTECPKCQGAVRKLLSSPAIQFKGSGWYITDYAKKSGTAAGSAKSEGSSGESKASDSSSTPAPKAEAKPSGGTT